MPHLPSQLELHMVLVSEHHCDAQLGCLGLRSDAVSGEKSLVMRKPQSDGHWVAPLLGTGQAGTEGDGWCAQTSVVHEGELYAHMPTLKSPGKMGGKQVPIQLGTSCKGHTVLPTPSFLLRSRRPPPTRREGAGVGGCFLRGPAPLSCLALAGSLLPVSFTVPPPTRPRGHE